MSDMFPHTVTIYNAHVDEKKMVTEYNITVIEPDQAHPDKPGVFLDISKASNVLRSGMSGADAATLYIPFASRAVNGLTGEVQQFVKPKEYDALEDKSGFWTLRESGGSSSVSCFFVKGRVVLEASFQTLNNRYDDVYRVSSVDTKDFGSPELQHWEIGGK